MGYFYFQIDRERDELILADWCCKNAKTILSNGWHDLSEGAIAVVFRPGQFRFNSVWCDGELMEIMYEPIGCCNKTGVIAIRYNTRDGSIDNIEFIKVPPEDL